MCGRWEQTLKEKKKGGWVIWSTVIFCCAARSFPSQCPGCWVTLWEKHKVSAVAKTKCCPSAAASNRDGTRIPSPSESPSVHKVVWVSRFARKSNRSPSAFSHVFPPLRSERHGVLQGAVRPDARRQHEAVHPDRFHLADEQRALAEGDGGPERELPHHGGPGSHPRAAAQSAQLLRHGKQMETPNIRRSHFSKTGFLLGYASRGRSTGQSDTRKAGFGVQEDTGPAVKCQCFIVLLMPGGNYQDVNDICVQFYILNIFI